MRYLVCAGLAALTLGLVQTGPAAAAASAWECMGPPASCVKAPGARKANAAFRATKSKKYVTAAGYTAKKKGNRKKPASYTYSGGGYSAGGSTGVASYYWQPQRVASGGWFNPNAMTAAHKTLPFGTKVRVTHLGNGRSVTVTINDRGPYVRGRIIDLSRAAASTIGMTGSGIARVSVAVLGRG